MKLVATVFEVDPEHVAAFRAAVFTSARDVERRNPDCRGVAIAEDPEAPGLFLTSALFADDAAAEQNDASPAGQAFEEAVRPYIKLKRVKLFDLG